MTRFLTPVAEPWRVGLLVQFLLALQFIRQLLVFLFQVLILHLKLKNVSLQFVHVFKFLGHVRYLLDFLVQLLSDVLILHKIFIFGEFCFNFGQLLLGQIEFQVKAISLLPQLVLQNVVLLILILEHLDLFLEVYHSLFQFAIQLLQEYVLVDQVLRISFDRQLSPYLAFLLVHHYLLIIQNFRQLDPHLQFIFLFDAVREPLLHQPMPDILQQTEFNKPCDFIIM